MSTILNTKYLSMPEQVQKNKNDIQIITEYLENIYKCSTALEESSTSINIEYTNIEDKRDFLFAFLLDNKGLLFKIIDIVGDIVYLEFYSKLPSVDFNYLGEWVAGNNEYHPNDVVLYNGSLYICENTILDSSVAPPQDTTNWSLFLGFGDDIGNFIINLNNNRDNIIYKKDITPVKLWENASPNSYYASETLYYDLTIYKRIRGIFKGWTTSSIYYTIDIEIGKNGIVIANPSVLLNNLNIDTREISVAENSITIFENKRWTQGNSDSVVSNSNNIPIAFYGLKY